MGDFALVVLLIGLVFACIWAVTWLISKIITLPFILWRKAFYEKTLADPIARDLLEQNNEIEPELPAQELKSRSPKTSPVARTDGNYPDSCDLALVTWFMHTPIRLSKPAKTPTGGHPTVVTAIVDVRFRVRSNTLEIISGRLCQSSYFSTMKTNVAAVRRGETWLADFSLESEIDKKLPRTLETELKTESQFRRAMWSRYFQWMRDEKKLIS